VVWSLREAVRKSAAFLPEFFARLSFRRDSGPLDSADSLARFVATRAAFVAQRTLYGYLKTRMGIRYPKMFEDDVIISSINIAKMHVFAACLSDLTIFAVSHALKDSAVEPSARQALALRCFREGLEANAAAAREVDSFSIAEAVAAFERRLSFWDWIDGPCGPEIFTESPAALYRWAPIAPALKKQDKEIVQNSIKFTWRDVRRNLEKRVDPAVLAQDVGGRPPAVS
jgi:hypothetical protein